MHILEIPSFFVPYGGEFCLEQSKALAMRGHEVRIVANVQLSMKRSLNEFVFAQRSSRQNEMDGITVIRREMMGLPKLIRPNVRRWVNGVISMTEEYIKTYGKPDIIHAHCAKWAGYAAMLIASKHSVPYVITEHLSSGILNTEFKYDNKTWQIDPLKQAYYNADMVIPVSEELVDDISFYFGKGYKYTPISNTIDTCFFHYKDREPLNGRPFRFCCLANFNHNKGYDILLPAFTLYCEKYPNSELHIAGTDTDNKELAKMIRSQYSLTSKIKVWGHLDKNGVRDLLYKSDCLVLATRKEAQGLVLLEAMRTGIPAITTDAVPKNVRIDGGCFICPANEIEPFADMMCSMHHNIYNTDGRKLSEEVENIASLRVVGEKLDRLFKEIIYKSMKKQP